MSFRQLNHKDRALSTLLIGALALLFFLPLPVAIAQKEDLDQKSVEVDLQADLTYRLVDRELILRSLTQRDLLDYDPSGYAITGAEQGPLTLSGVHIRSVLISPTKVILTGNRVALHYRSALPTLQRVELPNRTIYITIHRDAPGDRESYAGAIARIFATSHEQDFQERLPEWWHAYFSEEYRKKVIGDYFNFSEDAKFHKMDTSNIKLTHPKLIYGTTTFLLPDSDNISSAGSVRLRLIVNDKGAPIHTFIDTPLGFGLEEEAVRQSRKLRFTPATMNGNPTSGEVFVSINFLRRDEYSKKKTKTMASRLR